MWRKRECRQQSTELLDHRWLWKRKAGLVEYVVSMFAILLVVILLWTVLKISHIMIAGAYVEDALAASNLASALIDVKEYGRSRRIWIPDGECAYEKYREALCVNLQLDETGHVFGKGLLTGKVTIIEYTIYNVTGEQIEIIRFVEDGARRETEYGLVGEILTPDGTVVETTAVYSRVSFSVQGIGTQVIQAQMEKCVDIKRN